MARKHKLNLGAKPTLTVEIEGRGTFEVPLPGSLPMVRMQELMEKSADGREATAWFLAFFREHLGDVVDELTADDFRGLVEAWQGAGDPDMGESSA